MTALPVPLVLTVPVAAVAFAFVPDTVKAAVFARLKMVWCLFVPGLLCG
jgi:hypothetical protein